MEDLVHCIELNRPLQLREVEHAAEVDFQDVAAAENDPCDGAGVDANFWWLCCAVALCGCTSDEGGSVAVCVPGHNLRRSQLPLLLS